MTTFSCPAVLQDGRIAGPMTVTVTYGRIVSVAPGATPDADVVLESGVLTPGLLDLQNNGS